MGYILIWSVDVCTQIDSIKHLKIGSLCGQVRYVQKCTHWRKWQKWQLIAKIAIFAKIANLQGATFGIQFKSPEAGDFSPVSPFSPLHAWRFLPKSPISPKSPASKGPLLASNSNRQRLAIFRQFRHFRHCMHFWR